MKTMEHVIHQLEKTEISHDEKNCSVNQHERIMGIRDAIEVLSGKWKIQLIGTLLFGGKKRFMDLLRDMDGIAAKMLSKELQDLEAHQLVKRTVKETKPVTVEYEITDYGKSLEPVICEIAQWGTQSSPNHYEGIKSGSLKSPEDNAGTRRTQRSTKLHKEIKILALLRAIAPLQLTVFLCVPAPLRLIVFLCVPASLRWKLSLR